MRLKEEFTEAQRRFGLLSFYDKFEHIVILILTLLIAVFIVFAIWNLALKIVLSIASSTERPFLFVFCRNLFSAVAPNTLNPKAHHTRRLRCSKKSTLARWGTARLSSLVSRPGTPEV